MLQTGDDVDAANMISVTHGEDISVDNIGGLESEEDMEATMEIDDTSHDGHLCSKEFEVSHGSAINCNILL